MTARGLAPVRAHATLGRPPWPALAWVGAGVLLMLIGLPLVAPFGGMILMLLALPIAVLYGVSGLVILGLALHDLANRDRRRSAAATLLLVVSSLCAGWFGGWMWLARTGDAAIFHLRFAANAPGYARVVAAERRAPGASHRLQRRDGIGYYVEGGPPLRIAFPQPGGFLDNWEGVVYDPTGAVAQARGWRFDRGQQEFTAPPEVRVLFGGDLVECVHIRGAWYRCSFT